MFYTKDFIETAEGLCFAVVANGLEDGKVLCFLRYVKTEQTWQKTATEQANAFLKEHYPVYLHYSPNLDAHLHAVAVNSIVTHYRPRQRLQEIFAATKRDAIEQDLYELCQLLAQQGVDLAQVGVTGSILPCLQNPSSDIDLVCYERDVFHQCRAVTRELIALRRLHALNEQDWLASYERRSCALNYGDYVWHERRKGNKAIINNRKFDLSFVAQTPVLEKSHFQKQGAIIVCSRVVDDVLGFDYPAEFKLDHKHFSSVVSFSATYTGQVVKGEMVEISGLIEASDCGTKRLVVGSSREASGEYIKVIRG